MSIEEQFPSPLLTFMQPNTTGVAPATEALPTIKFARQNCVLILTDQDGNPAAIVRFSPSIASLITYCRPGISESCRIASLHYPARESDTKSRNLCCPPRMFPQIRLAQQRSKRAVPAHWVLLLRECVPIFRE